MKVTNSALTRQVIWCHINKLPSKACCKFTSSGWDTVDTFFIFVGLHTIAIRSENSLRLITRRRRGQRQRAQARGSTIYSVCCLVGSWYWERWDWTQNFHPPAKQAYILPSKKLWLNIYTIQAIPAMIRQTCNKAKFQIYHFNSN
jgi:hypothetical protein